MSITGHYINGIAKQPLSHVGTTQTPKVLVIHYSVTDTVAAAVTALNAANLSYHILIEKDGTAYQTRRFTEHAAHPGLSNWKAQSDVTLGSSLQRGSVGICLMNKGYAYGGSASAPGKLIYNPDDASMQRWEVYPAKLIASCNKIAEDIIKTYPIEHVVGHHDVAIMGKFDPGPLFDFTPLHDMLASPSPLGFKTKVKSPGSPLTVRRLPDAGSASVTTLNHGATVHIRSIAYGPKSACIHPSPGTRKRYLTRWASVDVNGSDTHAGFVNMKYLRQRRSLRRWLPIFEGASMAKMNISNAGLKELAGHEGIVQTRYQDSVKVWTLGIGHTKAAGPPDPKTFTGKLTLDEVLDLFKKDLKSYVADVNSVLTVTVSATEFDALVSFHFNTGGIKKAALVKSLNAGDKKKAAAQFMNWKSPPSIVDRRKKEQKLFADGVYSNGGKATVYKADSAGKVDWSSGKTVTL